MNEIPTQTTACVVGGGPGGTVLAFLLARSGVNVVLLEAHDDFDRDFRGDTIHPSVMTIMEQLELADSLLKIRHTKIPSLTLQSPDGPLIAIDFRSLKSRYPFITMLPQADFLDFIVGQTRGFPSFRIVMGARVHGLIEESGRVHGVRYTTRHGRQELRASLTVGADGRHSRIRKEGGFEVIKTSPPMDVLWFRIPRRKGHPEEAFGRVAPGRFIVALNRFDYWQIGYVIRKGTYRDVREIGITGLRNSLADHLPEIADSVDHLQEWGQVSFLSVESDRLKRWYRPGLLMIGDAAHTMSPVGGVGINYAIQDAVVAANILTGPLREGRVDESHLASVQRERELPTRVIQALQTLIQKRVLSEVLDAEGPFRPPSLLRWAGRLPLLRRLPARIIGQGVRTVLVETPPRGS